MTSDCVITWDVQDDSERASVDLDPGPKIFWDSDGRAYITEKDTVYITEQGVRLTCYDVEQVNAGSTIQSEHMPGSEQERQQSLAMMNSSKKSK